MHPEHRQAQRAGQQSFYAEYRLSVCAVLREMRFQREPGVAEQPSAQP
jgi:hypothetical protein